MGALYPRNGVFLLLPRPACHLMVSLGGVQGGCLCDGLAFGELPGCGLWRGFGPYFSKESSCLFPPLGLPLCVHRFGQWCPLVSETLFMFLHPSFSSDWT